MKMREEDTEFWFIVAYTQVKDEVMEMLIADSITKEEADKALLKITPSFARQALSEMKMPDILGRDVGD